VNCTKYIPAIPNRRIPIISFTLLNGLNMDFFSIKTTAMRSSIPETAVLTDTSQSAEKWNSLNNISPEIPEIDHRLAARLASSIPRNLAFVFIF
jgi:hypothetical protein